MGWKYEVSGWLPGMRGDGYAYEFFYQGDALYRAIRAMFAAKAAGAGCIRLEWRP
ncbi:hypothetical protein [Nocardia nova]